MILLRPLVRVLAFVLLVALSVAGLAVAVSSAVGASGPLSPPELARSIGLPRLDRSVGELLSKLEAPGGLAGLTLLSGLGAMAVGLLLLAGLLVPRRERLATLERRGDGVVAARRRPLAQALAALAEQARGVTGTRVQVRPGRRRGGRATVHADRTRPEEDPGVRDAVLERIEPLTEAFSLRPRIRVRAPGQGRRVE